MDNQNSTSSIVAGSLPADFCPVTEQERLETFARAMRVSQQLSAAGRIGEVGPQGIQGIQGIQGEQGIQGDIGGQGIQGLRGFTPCITFGVGLAEKDVPLAGGANNTYDVDLTGIPDHIPVNALNLRLQTQNVTVDQPFISSDIRTEDPRNISLTITFTANVQTGDKLIMTYPIYNLQYQFKDEAPVDQVIEGLSCE